MSETAPYPELEAVFVFGGCASPIGTLSVVSEGKNTMYQMNRRQIFGLMAQCVEVLKKMEPGR